MYYTIYNMLCIHVIFYMCRCIYNYVLYAYTYTYIFHLHINKIFQFIANSALNLNGHLLVHFYKGIFNESH